MRGRITLFTRWQLNSRDKAAELLDLFNTAESPFHPTWLGMDDSARTRYNSQDLDEAIRLLSGDPEHKAGSLFLKGPKGTFTVWLKWSQSTLSSWHFYLSPMFLNHTRQRERFIKFTVQLCEQFPVVYGGAAPEDDWDAKHWRITSLETGGTHSTKSGLGLEECLPGIYWVTVFGEKVVDFFGREKIQGLKVYSLVDLPRGGIIVRLRENPFKPELTERLRQDAEIERILGSNYFFNIHDSVNLCQPIPEVTQTGEPSW